MDLLPDDLRARLPPFGAMDEMSEPHISIHYQLPGTDIEWWVIAGQAIEEDFLMFGFISGINRFRYFRLSQLQGKRGPEGQTVVLDREFLAGGLSDVVPAPDI